MLDRRPVIAWPTGLPGAGKSTIAAHVDQALIDHGRHSAVLDGDDLRLASNADFAFTPRDLSGNVRRTAEVARLMAEGGTVVPVSLISPARTDRALARRVAGDIPVLEVFVDAPVAVCAGRDPEGPYVRPTGRAPFVHRGIPNPTRSPWHPT